ncbi:hypothetical protein LOTGIDRAFT_157314 [Lottia gigantea]|uniref:L-Fucosyltransferase n=1 Tax=Lottia gigantea TaxID=225164 RepID=V4CIZ3_LOTGI|nr:hypothetical protein LOTGIDRAFT_157314 [Lottia gigantea]ESP02160.1 hypothetical protein LOTGIDRAFT_157314 [Lottia gigantea]
MAKLTCWSRYILWTSLICIVVWYSLLNQCKQNVVPSLSEQNVKLSQSERHMAPNRKKINEKYLVYLCDEKRDCGGWGDRQRGMVSLFLLSLVWKRTFKILISSPCDIKPYYKPTKEYNWIFTDDELKKLKAKTKRTLAFISNDIPLLNLNMNNSEIAEVLYVKTNCYSYSNIAENYTQFLPDYLRNKNRATIFRETWNRFMIPTEKITGQVSKIMSTGKINLDAKKSGKELICAHLRIGRSKYLPHDYTGIPLTAVPDVWDFIDHHFHKKSRIFVATDNLDVRQSAMSKYGRRYIGSYAYTMNPDKMRSNLTLACSSQESAYVDQLMLSKCDVLIFYRRSGFSLHASYLKTKWREIYAIMGHTKNSVSLKKTFY